MKAIVVVDKNWAIGKENGLLAHLPGDLKYFKEKTLGKILIMGRKTLESLPGKKPLPKRYTLVMTTNEDYTTDFENTEETRLTIVNTWDELTLRLLELEYVKGLDAENDVFVAGGQSMYEMFMPYCDEFYVTKMDAEFPADKYFPNLDKYVEDGKMKMTWESEDFTENGITYRFTKYERV